MNERVAKIEKLITTAAKDRRKSLQQFDFDSVVRCHAIATAAIVMEGNPQIAEPLSKAWARTLERFRIKVSDPHSLDGISEAARQLRPKITDDNKPVDSASLF
jgi:hypothetical protein